VSSERAGESRIPCFRREGFRGRISMYRGANTRLKMKTRQIARGKIEVRPDHHERDRLAPFSRVSSRSDSALDLFPLVGEPEWLDVVVALTSVGFCAGSSSSSS